MAGTGIAVRAATDLVMQGCSIWRAYYVHSTVLVEFPHTTHLSKDFHMSSLALNPNHPTAPVPVHPLSAYALSCSLLYYVVAISKSQRLANTGILAENRVRCRTRIHHSARALG